MDAKTVNDSEIFVQLKMGMLNLKETEYTLNEAENEEIVRPMAILPNKDILRFFAHSDKTFGRISEDFGFKFTAHYGDYSVRLQSDSFTCQITDARLTTSGQVIMTDFKNKRIKKLSHSYAVTEHIHLPDFPACICEVDDKQLAVTLGNERKVQFVSQQPLALGKSFSVTDRCRGIYCYDGQLFVCCGGYTEKHEGPGHIDVFNLNGTLLRTHYEGLHRPTYITISENDTVTLFISEDKQNNLVTVDMNGDHVSKIQSKHLSQPRGVCLLGDNQLCITGEMSNNIVLLSNDGEQQELLREKDGLVRPRVVVFDEKQSRLVVCLHTSDMIKVFSCRH